MGCYMVLAMHPRPNAEYFIAYAPRGGGLLCAVTYLVHGDNVLGWWVGRDANAEYPPAFFMLENYYTRHEQAFLTTSGGDLQRGWTHDYDHADRTAVVPVEDAVARELERLQYDFAHAWLAYPEDADAAEQTGLYAKAELAMGSLAAGAVAVRFHGLGKFEKSQPVWRYFSHGLDYHLVERLMRRWPLEYKTNG